MHRHTVKHSRYHPDSLYGRCAVCFTPMSYTVVTRKDGTRSGYYRVNTSRRVKMLAGPTWEYR